MSLDLRLKAYLPNGASQGLLPAPDDFSLAIPLNDIPSLTVNYGVVGPRSDLLGQPLELAVETSTDGGATWTEPPDCRFLYLRDGRDPIRTADTWAVEAPGYLWRLQKARVLANGLADSDGRRTFTDKTPGYILATLWAEAQARGALSGMTLSGTALVDASAAAWGVTLTRSYDPGTDYLAVLTELASTGYLDFRMTGRTLAIYKPNTTMAVARTSGSSQVTLGPLQTTEAPFRRTWEGLADFIHVAGDNGSSVDITNPAALKPWGRWEDYVTQGGVEDTGTLTAVGQRYQELTADLRAEFTIGLSLGSGPAPMVDFMPGDYVWNRSLTGAPVVYRVRQVTLTKQGNSVLGNVVLNDRFAEQDISIRRALDAITGGASSAGSTGGTPTPPGPDILAPNAVTSLTASSVAYIDASGRAQAQITLNWPDVTTNADGSPMTDLAEYQVWYREDAVGTWRQLTTTEDTTSAITLSPFEPGSAWEFRVRAVDASTNWGAFSPVEAVTAASDNTPPAVASQAVLSTTPGTLRAAWDGENAAGNPMGDADFLRAEVHASPVAAFNPTPGDSATMLGALTGPGSVESPGFAPASTWYVRIVTVDTSGNAAAASAVASIVIAKASDGAVPVPPGGWTATLAPLGVMALQAAWPVVPNADAVTYDVYVSDVTIPATPAPGDLYGSTASTNMALQRLPSGDPFVAGQDYHVRVVPRDDDGSGTASGMATSPVRQADGPAISPSWVYTNGVEAAQIQAGDLEAALAILGELRTARDAGRNVALSTQDGVLVTDQNDETVAHIPTDPSLNIQMLLHAILMSATALGPVAFRSLLNEVAQNAAIIMRAGTAAPVTPPTVKVLWPEMRFSPVDDFASWARSSHIASGVLYEVWATFGASGVILRNPATGAETSRWDLTPTTLTPYGGVRIGSFLYLLVADTTRYKGGNVFNSRHYVRKYDLAGAYQGVEWEYDAAADNTGANYPTVGYDGTNLLIARSVGGNIKLEAFTPDTGALIATRTSAINVGAVALGSVNSGTFDLGAARYIVTTRSRPGGDLVLVMNTGVGAPRDTALEWPVPNSDLVGGMTWDSAASEWVHRSMSRNVYYRYQGNFWSGTTPQAWKAVNTWRDTNAGGTGLHETSKGPPASFSMPKRASVQITSPAIPSDPNPANLDDPTAVRVYLSQGGDAVADYFLQASPADGVIQAVIHKAIFSNADTLHPNPPTSGNFPDGTPGLIRADNPAYYFNGQGELVVKSLAIIGESFADIAFSAGYVSFDTGAWEAQLTVKGGLATMRGLVKPSSGSFASAAAVTVAVIPAKYRPTNNELWSAATANSGVTSRNTLLPDGTLVVQPSAATAYVSLCHSWRVD